MADWTTFFGAEIQTKQGKKSTVDALKDKKVIGIYFSAHWCPPCRQFTPVLGTVYEDMIEDHPDFEIVFVSSDRDEGGFNEYYGEMPWVALPFASQKEKGSLAQKYGVSGIPCLVFLNDKGDLITKDGRSVIAGSNGDGDKIWSELTK